MFRKANLAELMREELPPIAYQKRLCYRTDYDEVVALYRLINKTIFNNKLIMPEIEVMARCRKYWGMCIGSHDKLKNGSYCKIELMDKWISPQWMIATLAHEMVHQYQWDIAGPEREAEGLNAIMSHGPSFFQFRDLLKEHNIPLKTAHSQRRWYKHQSLFKC